MATSKPSKQMIICYGCRRNHLDYPFAHQYCQHIVCGKCSYGNKKKLYCIKCETSMIQTQQTFAVQATVNGYSEQVASIIEAAFGKVLAPAREGLFVDSPGAYAEATVQSSTVLSVASARPLIDQIPKRDPTCMETTCDNLCCCCIWRPLGSCGKQLAIYLFVFIVICWGIWFLNLYITGNPTMRNWQLFNVPGATEPTIPPVFDVRWRKPEMENEKRHSL